MEPIDDVHAARYSVQEHAALGGRQHAARRGKAANEVIRNAASAGDRLSEIAHDRNAIGRVTQYLSGIFPDVRAVENRNNRVFLGVADEPVGGFAVLFTECALAIDDSLRSVRGHCSPQ